MNDLQAWHKAQALSWECYEKLSTDRRELFDRLVDRIMHLKESLLGLALAEDSRQICGECGGKCCLYGKYHVSMLDLIVCRLHSSEFFIPEFMTHPFCPYCGESGCSFAPRFKPSTCIVFNCELIEERLDEDARRQAGQWERELREAVANAEMIAERRLSRPALLICGI